MLCGAGPALQMACIVLHLHRAVLALRMKDDGPGGVAKMCPRPMQKLESWRETRT